MSNQGCGSCVGAPVPESVVQIDSSLMETFRSFKPPGSHQLTLESESFFRDIQAMQDDPPVDDFVQSYANVLANGRTQSPTYMSIDHILC
jgi:hypothetical protein